MSADKTKIPPSKKADQSNEDPELTDEELEGSSGGLKITMKKVLISSYSTGGAGGEDEDEASTRLASDSNDDELGR